MAARLSSPDPQPSISLYDDLELLLAALPPSIRAALDVSPRRGDLLEVVLDLGRLPEARYPDGGEDLSTHPVSRDALQFVVERVGRFGLDNRAGIARTLHRVSAFRNRLGEVVGLTCRVGRAVVGTVDVVRDAIESDASILILGRPGVGKTTLLREAARVLADELGKRVVIVDTSNEIGGDGDIPHPGVGRARRMQVPVPEAQHAVMIEAVENHMPEVIVIDEIGTAAEALAARTIAERGVRLIGTAHGNTIENLLQNPTLADLVGGVQTVVLSDEEARRRGTQKTVIERRAPPTFSTLVEIQDKTRFALHRDLADVVDRLLRGALPRPEIRVRTADGVEVLRAASAESNGNGFHRQPEPDREPARERAWDWPRQRERVARHQPGLNGQRRTLRVFPYAVSRSKIDHAIHDLGLDAEIVHRVEDADVVLALKSHEKRQPPRLREAHRQGVPFQVVKNNSNVQIENALRALRGR